MHVKLKQRLHLWILVNVCLLYAGVPTIKSPKWSDTTSDVLFMENEPMHSGFITNKIL